MREALVETLPCELDGGTGGVSVDREGTVFVADFGARLDDRAAMGRRIFRVHPDGRSDVFATGFEGASGNEFDSRGILYQSSIRGNFISRVAPDGSHSVFAREGLNAPVGIAVDEDDALFVACCGDGSIRRIAPDGASSLFVSDPLLRCPNGLALDEDRTLYVSNFDNGDVVRITPGGKVDRLVTLPGGNNAHLTFLGGALYVVARGDHRVYKVSLDGTAEPFAGTGERGRRDGPASTALFSCPNDIAPGPDGSLTINEIAATTGPSTELRPMVVRRIRFAS